MYSLGIAHTIGKETILVCPQGSKFLVDIPKTNRIEYENSDNGIAELKQSLSDMLKAHLESMEML
jgi:hypothetical protein